MYWAYASVYSWLSSASMAWERSSRAVYVVCGVVYEVYEVRQDQRSNHSQRHTVRLHRGNYLAPWMTCRFSHRGDGKIMGSGLRLQSKESKRHCAWLHQGDSTAGAGFLFLFLEKKSSSLDLLSRPLVRRSYGGYGRNSLRRNVLIYRALTQGLYMW